MADVIENPILNSPYWVPTRHFAFDDHGITSEIVEGREPNHFLSVSPIVARQRCGAGSRSRW